MTLEWSERLSVGDAVIDGQHRKLIEIVNRLAHSIESGVTRLELDAVASELERYVIVHFRYEERKMEAAGNPDLEGHQREHRQFIKKLAHLSDDLRSGSSFAASTALRWLIDWYGNHVLLVDHKYKPWIGGA